MERLINNLTVKIQLPKNRTILNIQELLDNQIDGQGISPQDPTEDVLKFDSNQNIFLIKFPQLINYNYNYKPFGHEAHSLKAFVDFYKDKDYKVEMAFDDEQEKLKKFFDVFNQLKPFDQEYLSKVNESLQYGQAEYEEPIQIIMLLQQRDGQEALYLIQKFQIQEDIKFDFEKMYHPEYREQILNNPIVNFEEDIKTQEFGMKVDPSPPGVNIQLRRRRPIEVPDIQGFINNNSIGYNLSNLNEYEHWLKNTSEGTMFLQSMAMIPVRSSFFNLSYYVLHKILHYLMFGDKPFVHFPIGDPIVKSHAIVGKYDPQNHALIRWYNQHGDAIQHQIGFGNCQFWAIKNSLIFEYWLYEKGLEVDPRFYYELDDVSDDTILYFWYVYRLLNAVIQHAISAFKNPPPYCFDTRDKDYYGKFTEVLFKIFKPIRFQEYVESIQEYCKMKAEEPFLKKFIKFQAFKFVSYLGGIKHLYQTKLDRYHNPYTNLLDLQERKQVFRNIIRNKTAFLKYVQDYFMVFYGPSLTNYVFTSFNNMYETGQVEAVLEECTSNGDVLHKIVEQYFPKQQGMSGYDLKPILKFFINYVVSFDERAIENTIVQNPLKLQVYKSLKDYYENIPCVWEDGDFKLTPLYPDEDFTITRRCFLQIMVDRQYKEILYEIQEQRTKEKMGITNNSPAVNIDILFEPLLQADRIFTEEQKNDCLGQLGKIIQLPPVKNFPVVLKTCLDSSLENYYIINREIIQFAQSRNINLFLRSIIKMKIPNFSLGFMLNTPTYLELTDSYRKQRDSTISSVMYLLQPINIGGYYQLFEEKLREEVKSDNPFLKTILYETEQINNERLYRIDHVAKLKRFEEIFHGVSQAELEQKYNELVNSILTYPSEENIALARKLIVQKGKMILDSDIQQLLAENPKFDMMREMKKLFHKEGHQENDYYGHYSNKFDLTKFSPYQRGYE